jgi:hypothetical protein
MMSESQRNAISSLALATTDGEEARYIVDVVKSKYEGMRLVFDSKIQ